MESAQQQYRSNGGDSNRSRSGSAQRFAETTRKNAIELPEQIDTLKSAIESLKRTGTLKNVKEIEKELGEKVRDGLGNRRLEE
jgi:hypothetical protein